MLQTAEQNAMDQRHMKAKAREQRDDQVQKNAELVAQVDRLRGGLNQAIELLVAALIEPQQITDKEICELRDIEQATPAQYLTKHNREVAARAVEVVADELSRELFEKQVKNKGWSTDFISLNGKFHAYSDPDIDNMWLGWSAAIKGLSINANKIKSGEVKI